MWIGNVVARRQVRSRWAEGVAGFTTHPLFVGELPGTRRDIVQGHVSGNVFQRFLRGNGFRFASDYHCQFGLVVHIGIARRDHDCIARAGNAGGEFGEDHGRLGQFLGTRFNRMITVIQPYCDDFSGMGNRRKQANIAQGNNATLGNLLKQLASFIQNGFSRGQKGQNIRKGFGPHPTGSRRGLQINHSLF